MGLCDHGIIVYMKTCPKCNESKSLTEFRTRQQKGRTYPSPYCKPCTKTDLRERVANGYVAPPKTAKNKVDNTRQSWLKNLKLKGITEEEYYQMKEAQGGKCAICPSETPWARSNTWHVDHCHETGKVRGLLCANCNRGLGYFRDNTDLLREAIAYLDNSRLVGPEDSYMTEEDNR